MMIRDTQPGELEHIRGNSLKGYDMLNPPCGAEEAITLLDDDGVPRLVMKAERVAEVYMVIDHTWQTPAMRWTIIELAHKEMRGRLLRKRYTVAYSFFADGVPNSYVRRLVGLGWQRVVDRCVRFAAGR